MMSSLVKIVERPRRANAGLFSVCVVSFVLVAPSAFAWPDLRIVKSGPAQAAPGDVITYTLSYSNIGPVKSTLVTMKDFLPANVTLLTNTLNGGTLAGSTITWSLGTMNSGTSGTRSFQAVVQANATAGWVLTNRAQIFGKEAEEAGKTNDNYSTLLTTVVAPPPDFCRAILAKQPISLHGTMEIDSFNSRDPTLSTNGRYDSNKRGAAGNVASIADSLTVISDTGNTKVYGKFETGPSGAVRITGNASVGSVAWVDGGNRGIEPGWYLTNLSQTIPDAVLPGVSFATLPKTAGTVGGTNYTYVLNTGNYVRSTDLTLSSNEKMVINGNVRLYFQQKLTITGSAFIYLTPGSKLTVYLAGTTSVAGGGTVNGTGLAENCAFIGLPACTSISFTGNSEFIGTVYAPQANVQLAGGGSQEVNFIGAVVGKSVTVTGNYRFHYDQGLCETCLPPTVLTAPVSLTNCPGSTASFSVTARGADLTYVWFKNGVPLPGKTNSILTLTNVSTVDAGVYQVDVRVPCGDVVRTSATLTVNDAVSATALANLTRSAGNNATFATSASGTGPFTYVWRKDGVVITAVTASSLTLTNIRRSDAGTYSVEVFGACGSVTKSATLTVLNSAPQALNDQYSLLEDSTLTIAAPGVLANDTDSDGDPLTAILSVGPTNGVLMLNPNGSFTYRPNMDFVGVDSFTYRAFDGADYSEPVTVTFTVLAVNDAPIARPDVYSVAEDTLLTITAPGVLGNDSDPDGDPLTAILVNGPLHGTLTLNPNGGFTYRPATNYFGPDSFTYRANDGTTNSEIVTVTFNVTAVNDAPIAQADNYTVGEDGVLTINAPGVLGNDSDPDGDVLTASLVNAPTHGMLMLNPNGSFTYTPNANYSGTDSFTYRANDGTTNSEIVTVTFNVTAVNDIPVAQPDSYTTVKNIPLTVSAPGVLSNDSDVDNDPLTAVLVTGPAHGQLVLNASGGFNYIPMTNYAGSDTFTYRASDGVTNSGITTVTITMTQTNRPPDTNNWTGSQFTAYEDTALNVSAPGVLAGIVDVDGDVLRVIPVSGTIHGTLTLNTNGSFRYLAGTNYFGPDSFQFRVTDGQVSSAILTATINVLPVNDPPSFVKGGDPRIQLNSGAQTVVGWATQISPGPTNEANQTVAFEVTSSNPALFTVAPAISANGTLTYTPAPNATGTVTLMVVARDNGGTANGGVNGSLPLTFAITINAPPTVQIVSPTNGASFFVPGNFTVLADANDSDGSIVKVEFYLSTNKISVVTNAPYFVVLTNLPSGNYTFTAVATDDFGATNSSTPVTVSVIQRPPLTLLTSVYYNPQTDFFEQRVRVSNPTYSTLDAVRVLVYNLTNAPAITVGNPSGFANGIPYVQTYVAVPPGGFVDMTIEYLSPLRIMPHPVLSAELVTPPGSVTPLSGMFQRVNRSFMLANRTFLVEFATVSNRVYAIQYSADLVQWKNAQPSMTGNGNWVQWIDNGLPKTEAPPAEAASRFYRVILLP